MMKKKFKIIYLATCVMLTMLISACIDESDYDFSKVATVEWEPSYAFKLLYGEMSLNDITDDLEDFRLNTYEDGLLYFYYESENESDSLSNIIELPDVSLERTFNSEINLVGSINSELEVINTTFVVDLGIEDGEIDSIFYRNFPIDFDIITSIDEVFNLNFTFPTFSSEGEPISIDFFKNNNGNTINESELFEEFVAALNTLDPPYNQFPVELTLTLLPSDNIVITEGDYLYLNMQLRNQDFLWVKGYFYPTSRIISDQDISVDLFENNFSEADYDLEGTKLTFEITNEFGVPISLDFKSLHAINAEGETLPIETDPVSPFFIDSPTVLGDSAVSRITVTNAVDVFKFSPVGFDYEIEATINEGFDDGRNFLSVNSRAKVKFIAEVPLWGMANGIAIKDTLEVDFTEMEDSQINAAFLKTRIENGYPVDVNIQAVLLDENYNFIDSLFLPSQTLFATAARTGDSGIEEVGIYDEEIELNENKLNSLENTSHILLIARLNTFKNPDGTMSNVKFFEQGKINIDMGIRAGLKMEVKINEE